ncbi:glycosyltransferase [Puia dinghuensis]|uniref:Glycosyl transferase n=1 Tax=Puia dinghuensis TaxID=1792502 RepID=A0A8J2U6F8_9BACT|nr:glycosyltransferase [Puia dinghuensis]GGA82332.1 glycosyl transferase [Puia dinghuensis]
MTKRLFFTVTNDLVFDQRMIRICASLARAGYAVTLVGFAGRHSPPLSEQPFHQHRLKTWFNHGKRFYIEYNLRLFFFLLRQKMDGICAIDLDTILPCYFLSRLRRIPRLYDAHELFCELQEVVSRPLVYKLWKTIERYCVPRFPNGYTVNSLIAAQLCNMYGVQYAVIRNVPPLDLAPTPPATGLPAGRFILYQGAINEGRCFETLIPAMQSVNAPLVICGDGNFMTRAHALVRQYGLEEKILFRGRVRPEELKTITRAAFAGITLFDRRGISNYYSLANRFFDYIHAGIPQVTVNYPAYQEINNSCPIAVLIDEPGIREIAEGLNRLLDNTRLYQTLVDNCRQVRLRYNWQEEEQTLIRLYQHLFN